MDKEHRLKGEDMALNKLDDTEEPTVNSPININHYATKKSVAQSMLDVALLMANSSQLKTVVYVGPEHHFYILLIILLSLSIILQIIVGLLFIFIVKYDLNDIRKHSRLNSMNNMATVFVLFTVLINIFTTVLGFEGHPVRSSVSHGVSLPEPQVSRLSFDLNTTSGI